MSAQHLHPKYVAEGEFFVFPVNGEVFSIEGPCYVSTDETSVYFPDHNIYMSVPRWQRDFAASVHEDTPQNG